MLRQSALDLLRKYRYVPAFLVLMLSVALAYSILLAPFQYVLHPRFGTITYAVAIYGWRDFRVDLLEVLLIQAVLLAVLSVASERAFRLATYCALAFSAFNLVLPIVVDYGVNLSNQSPFPGFWMKAASDAYQVMISQRLVVDLPRQVGIWAASTTLAFAYIRARRGLKVALLDSSCFAFAILTAFEVGSHIVDPTWASTYVTLLQLGTSFQWFSNDDLLVVSGLGLALLAGARLLFERREMRLPT